MLQILLSQQELKMKNINLGSSYSSIISPEDYNRLMSKEHLYINQSDIFITEKIKEFASKGFENIVELGCGPARLLRRVASLQNINITGVDVDADFVHYAKSLLKGCNHVNIICESVFNLDFANKADLFYSQGFHHHLAPGNDRHKYLSHIHSLLRTDGYYRVGDEYIPDYTNNQEREILLVIWYCHIIAHAIKHNHHYLAQEEAKTLLDDLQTGRVDENIKTTDQINLVLRYAPKIDSFARGSELQEANVQAKLFLNELAIANNITYNNDISIDASRGDYKICDSVFIEEVQNAGFKVVEKAAYGPIETIGALVVYILQKS